jgi:hypothetical protein
MGDDGKAMARSAVTAMAATMASMAMMGAILVVLGSVNMEVEAREGERSGICGGAGGGMCSGRRG